MEFSSEYLDNCPLKESLLLSLDHHLLQSTVVLVYDYAAAAVSEHFSSRLLGSSVPTQSEIPKRDFRKITFNGVSDYKISRGPQSYGRNEEFTLSQRTRNPGVIIESTKLLQGRTPTIVLSLSANFSASWKFSDAVVEFKICYARRNRFGDWQYFGSDDHRLVDFYLPFGEGI